MGRPYGPDANKPPVLSHLAHYNIMQSFPCVCHRLSLWQKTFAFHKKWRTLTNFGRNWQHGKHDCTSANICWLFTEPARIIHYIIWLVMHSKHSFISALDNSFFCEGYFSINSASKSLFITGTHEFSTPSTIILG